ncbi:MAG: AMP-binding protein, partial [Pseudonocardia sp.]|nr:AMP-binding protein [Pseudonocardia sp.]
MNRLLPLEPSDKVALRFGPPGDAVELTYRELAAAAGALVPRITGCGRVAVHATPTIHTVVGVVAGLLAGVPVVPLNPRLGERELAH